MNLYTSGYEGIKVNEFIELLKNNNVEVLVDIRGNPNSRKPGFSKKALAAALNERGIAYAPFYGLGVPRDIRKAYHQTGDWETFSQGYLEYLTSQGEEVARLAEKARDQRCCLLCFEADYTRCHRFYVAKAVKEAAAYPLDIIHLDVSARAA